MALRLCNACARHVRAHETRCPFCDASLTPSSVREPSVTRASRAAQMAFVATVLAGCREERTANPPAPPVKLVEDTAPATSVAMVADAAPPEMPDTAAPAASPSPSVKPKPPPTATLVKPPPPPPNLQKPYGAPPADGLLV